MKRLVCSLLLLLLIPTLVAGTFNMKVEIPDEYRHIEGGDVYVSFSLFNLENQERKDITIEYWVMGPEGEFGRMTETLAIETQASLVRSITVPEHAVDGRYSIQGRVLYGEGKEQLSSATFYIEQPETFDSRWLYYGAGIFGILILVLILFRSSKGIKKVIKRFLLKQKIRGIVKRRLKAPRSPPPNSPDTSAVQE
jgi:hypothetical protein